MLKLITFDADGTLYADGSHMEHDNEMIRHIVNLMRANVHVAIVTAAGYPGDPARFEQRIQGLLAAFRQLNLPKSITDRCAWRRPWTPAEARPPCRRPAPDGGVR
jgi:IMP and pyridine-specific 5'-nucleotidase